VAPRSRGSARVAVSIALGVLLFAGGTAYASYRYDVATANRLLPGVTIAGIDVGEMTREEAVAAVQGEIDADLGREIVVEAGDQVWRVSPGELGTSAEVEAAVDEALAVNTGYAWTERVFRRLLDRPVNHDALIRYRADAAGLRDFVTTAAETVAVAPSNASVDYVDGELVVRRPEFGQELAKRDAKRALRAAVMDGSARVVLPTERIEPKVGKEDLGHTIVVDLSDLQLTLYEGVRKVKSYPVAAGSAEYPTPTGDWTIWDKRENPVWINPAPDGWGASLPAMIPGGPSNPLGTRALYLDAPGIRIHGTSASYSIGSYASHGCVRMLMSDVEELYEIVPIGTTVHIVS
jgi:lipoprotein-anchoring transpeptidase ErfK/SrfK